MRSSSTPSSQEKAKILDALLRAKGHDVEDFEVEEDSAASWASDLGVDDDFVIVRRRSTRDARLYACGPGSVWLGALLLDLAHGHFGPPGPAAWQAGASATTIPPSGGADP